MFPSKLIMIFATVRNGYCQRFYEKATTAHTEERKDSQESERKRQGNSWGVFGAENENRGDLSAAGPQPRVDSIEDAQTFVEGMTFADFSKDRKTVNAVIRSVEVIGEAEQNALGRSRADGRRGHFRQSGCRKAEHGHDFMGGDKPRKTDAEIAKNYFNEKELDVLNRIVNMYLEFAELQALNRKPMYMSNWISKLDDFLKLSGRDILTHPGKISHDEALEKAYTQYEQYGKERLKKLSPVERQFLEAVGELE